jgi:hypothetical protein
MQNFHVNCLFLIIQKKKYKESEAEEENLRNFIFFQSIHFKR